MLKAPLPRRADLRRLVARQGQLAGSLALADLPRLDGLLTSRSGFVEVELTGSLDDEQRRIVAGVVRGQLQMQCQRCLRPMTVTIEQQLSLALLWSESEIEHLARELDPLVVGDEPFDLWELVSDELLLALPIVARHANPDCAGDVDELTGAGDAPQQEKRNPFSALAGLKKRR